MDETPQNEIPELGADAGLQQVLAAWHSATVRLERTHETLQAEVRRLTDELEAKNRQLARKNRLADLGQFATHIAHELRNSLMPVTLYLSLLKRRITADEASLETLSKIETACMALDATVNDLLHFATDRPARLEPVRVGDVVGDTLSALGPQLEAQQIAAEVRVPAELRIQADRLMLGRALLNLVLNAVDAMPDGGALSVSAAVGPNGPELQVIDSGPGLSEEAMRRACEPFFTTKPHGTGLGLAIVERIAAAHGGRILADNAPGGGAAFTLRLPRTVQENAA